MDEVIRHLEYEGNTFDLEGLDVRASKAIIVLMRYAKHIRARYEEKRKKGEGRLPPYEAANGYLKRAVYAFTRYLIKTRRIRVIENAVDQAAFFKKNPRSPDVKENPFYWVLVLVFPNDELKSASGDQGPMFQQERNRLGLQLLYAHIHNVPPEYVVGFLYQSGGPERVLPKLKARQPELWLKSAWPEQKKVK